MRTYKKPMITVDSGLAEGVYAASGSSQGILNVTYHGVWDRWGTNGGKGLAMANWSDLNGTITLNITFNDTVIRLKQMMLLFKHLGLERLLHLHLQAQQQIRLQLVFT